MKQQQEETISEQGQAGGWPDSSGALSVMIGKSRIMRQVFSLIDKVCDSDSTVLIQGESGTGKELIAKALHFRSRRKDCHFVPVNCGAIPGELLESELFGHEKGAFTNAFQTRIGRFELAHGGTVFLDEIAEMSPMLQVKLLRVLQEKQFERVGGVRMINSDFRIIAATNRDLEEEVARGNFREDLFYRLTVIPIKAPALRQRPVDIPLLIDYFLKKADGGKGRRVEGIDDDALEHLINYPWPGNVRELENLIERMKILASSPVIAVDDLPSKFCDSRTDINDSFDEIPDTGFFLSKVVASYEKRLIVQALRQTGWVKNRAAKLLNVNRTTLLEKMKRAGIVREDH